MYRNWNYFDKQMHNIPQHCKIFVDSGSKMSVYAVACYSSTPIFHTHRESFLKFTFFSITRCIIYRSTLYIRKICSSILFLNLVSLILIAPHSCPQLICTFFKSNKSSLLHTFLCTYCISRLSKYNPESRKLL